MPAVRRKIAVDSIINQLPGIAAETRDAIKRDMDSLGRANKREVPSGEKRGLSSGPDVRATSPPPSNCLSQILGVPSRSEENARMRPSGDTAGEKSRPE